MYDLTVSKMFCSYLSIFFMSYLSLTNQLLQCHTLVVITLRLDPRPKKKKKFKLNTAIYC